MFSGPWHATDKAKVVYSPKEQYLPYGKPASLDCHFSANPPLTNLRWEKDGFLFDPYNVPGVFYSRNGSLLFNQVTTLCFHPRIPIFVVFFCSFYLVFSITKTTFVGV